MDHAASPTARSSSSDPRSRTTRSEPSTTSTTIPSSRSAPTADSTGHSSHSPCGARCGLRAAGLQQPGQQLPAAGLGVDPLGRDAAQLVEEQRADVERTHLPGPGHRPVMPVLASHTGRGLRDPQRRDEVEATG